MYASTLPRSNWLRRASSRLAWYRHMPASSFVIKRWPYNLAVFTVHRRLWRNTSLAEKQVMTWRSHVTNWTSCFWLKAVLQWRWKQPLCSAMLITVDIRHWRETWCLCILWLWHRCEMWLRITLSQRSDNSWHSSLTWDMVSMYFVIVTQMWDVT